MRPPHCFLGLARLVAFSSWGWPTGSMVGPWMENGWILALATASQWTVRKKAQRWAWGQGETGGQHRDGLLTQP